MDFARLPSFAQKAWHSARAYALLHKGWSIVAAIVVLGGGYYVYGTITAPSTSPEYYTATVSTGTVVASIAETGQVSATSQVDLQSKSSGQVLQVLVAPGQHVAAGTALAYLDGTNAQAALRSAQSNLAAAQLSLQKIQEPADAVSLTQAQNSVASAQAAVTQAHTSGYNDVTSAFLDLPNTVSGLDNILHSSIVPGNTSEQNENAYADMVSTIDPSVTQYMTTAETAYQTAYTAYTKAIADFKSTPRTATDAQLEALVQESYTASADISDALKASSNFLNFTSTTLTAHHLGVPSILTTQINSLTTYTNQTNSHVSALSNDTATVVSSERSLAAAQATLAKTQTGADPLDVQSSQLSVQRSQDAVTSAQIDLGNTVVRAPFDGVVAKLDVQRYQTIGTGTTVATMVSDHQSANLSLNEVDAAKLSVGQKATLTFDAIPDITIAGTVSSVDALGTVSSGVVSYGAVITFDTDNAQIKPGMSTSASIVTATGSGLVVPSSAVKTVAGASYVQVFTPPLVGSSETVGVQTTLTPTRVPVAIGLSDDTNTIVTSGLTEGAQVVSRTSTVSTAAKTTTAAAATSRTAAPRGATPALRGL